MSSGFRTLDFGVERSVRRPDWRRMLLLGRNTEGGDYTRNHPSAVDVPERKYRTRECSWCYSGVERNCCYKIGSDLAGGILLDITYARWEHWRANNTREPARGCGGEALGSRTERPSRGCCGCFHDAFMMLHTSGLVSVCASDLCFPSVCPI